MMRPLIQIDDSIREMTDEEYEHLVSLGWTVDGGDDSELSKMYASGQ